jgi:hypothetical protein
LITPTKGIAPQRALLTVAAQIMRILDEPMTTSTAWRKLADWRDRNGAKMPISFDWFALALSVLYGVGLVHLEDGILYKVERG